MNFQEILTKIKQDRILQIIIVLSLFFFFIFVIRPIFFSPKKPEIPCYNAKLKIWSPFKEDDLYPLISPFTRYCVSFEIKEKTVEEIKKDLLLALAGNDFPDIVYLDNDYLNEFSQFFATPTTVNIDALVAYYNKDFLNFFQLKKPRTLDELKEFIKATKDYQRENFYPLGLGTKEIRNRKEIILSLMSLNPDYDKKEKIRENLYQTLSIYNSFSDSNSEFFSYPQDAGDDLNNFTQEKLTLYLGFYQDKKEILSKNPRLNYEIYFSPLNTFPPKAKTYTKIYHFAPLRKGNYKVAGYFLGWFSKYQLKKLVEIYDLVPFAEDENLTQEQKIIVETVKSQGETFDLFNKKIIFENLDNLLEVWQNESEARRILEQIYRSL